MHQKRLEMSSITLENPQNRSESPKIYLFRTKIAQICQTNPRFETSDLATECFLSRNQSKPTFKDNCKSKDLVRKFIGILSEVKIQRQSDPTPG